MAIQELFPTTGRRGPGARARVVVLGGGYAGQLAAQALAARTDAAVTLSPGKLAGVQAA